MKKIFCLLFSFGLLVLLTACQTNADQNTATTTVGKKAEKIEVVHFHGTQQCWSCETVGEYTKQTLETNFSKELAAGTISFQSINGDLPENAAIVNKYQARGSSLFINTIYDGQDHISEDVTVWRLVGSQSQFESYFRDKINQLLER